MGMNDINSLSHIRDEIVNIILCDLCLTRIQNLLMSFYFFVENFVLYGILFTKRLNKERMLQMALELHSLTCPNCHSNLEYEDGIDTFYCKYCGYKIILNGQSEAAYRAKTKIQGMKHDEYMVEQKYAHERYKIKNENEKHSKEIKRCIIFVVVFMMLVGVMPLSGKISSDRQEKELNALATQIQIDIKNQDYDMAYLKAQSLKYTENWSSGIEEKWDSVRRELINQIIEAEINTTGRTTHKPEEPEKEGLLDWLFK